MIGSNLYEVGSENYANITEELVFLSPAVEVTNLMGDYFNRVGMGLDIGTGTGVILSEAKKKFGDNLTLFGLDSSANMLRVACKRGFKYLIYSKLPDTPFIDDTFDFVTANFVVSHIKETQKLTNSIHRILRNNGHFIFTSWGKGNSPYNEIWNRVLHTYLSKDHVKKLANQSIPHEEKFRNPNTVIHELEKDSKFFLAKNYTKNYSNTLSLEDYLECRYSFLIGRYLKGILSNEMWREFTDKMYDSFLVECGETIEMNQVAHFFAFKCKKQ